MSAFLNDAPGLYGNDVFPARPSVCLLSHLDCAPSASLVAKSSVPLASTSLLRGVMHFLGMSQEEPTPLFVDNEGTVKIANWTASQKRSMYLVRPGFTERMGGRCRYLS